LIINRTNIKSLNLAVNRIGNNGLECLATALADNQKLLDLNLSRNQISSVPGLSEMLTCNRTLTSLDLSFNPINSSEGDQLIKALERNHRLTSCAVHKTNLTNDQQKLISDLCERNKRVLEKFCFSLSIARKLLSLALPHELLAQVLGLYTSHLPAHESHLFHSILLSRHSIGMIADKEILFSPLHLLERCRKL
jgi:hypothetical protein